MLRTALCVALRGLMGCNVIETDGGPLTVEECTQLHDKFDEIFTQGLSEEEAEEFLSYQDTEQDIADCVANQPWDRAGFRCAMKQTNEGGLKSCILRSR